MESGCVQVFSHQKSRSSHTALDVRFDWANAWLLGKACSHSSLISIQTAPLVLDAKGMDIHQVAMVNKGAKTNLNWTYDSLQITIDLGREYKKDEQYTVYIDYTARPEDRPEGGSFAITSDKGLYFINRDGSVADKPTDLDPGRDQKLLPSGSLP